MGPEELLAQIRTLLEQYVGLGGDTPVAAEAAALASAIDAATGGGGEEMGGVPPEGAMPPAPEEGMPPPELEAGPPADTPMPTDFGEASALALEDLKKKTKAPAY